ncbi:MAG: DUF6261 family protein [Tannerella sp.]|jgi:hypothetical protein|nr:DUF6261 family protein [Tannerella sp.]
MKLKRIDLHSLHNEEHFNFMRVIIGLLNVTAEDVKAFINVLIVTLTALLTREEGALEKIRKSPLTDPIMIADELRDSIFRGLELLVEGFMHSAVEAEAAAAKEIQLIIDHYGNVTKKAYNEESGLIYNFIQDLRERCQSALTTLNLTRWVNDLEEANAEFDNLMNRRFEKGAEQDSDSMREIRRSMDLTYQQLVHAVEVGSQLSNSKADYDHLINEMNQRIDYYRNTLSHRKGIKKKAGKNSEKF